VDILLKNKEITLTIEGYAHRNEGSDTICKYLSLNRALFVRDYILGRGVDSSRIESVRAMSKANPKIRSVNKQGLALNCRVELKMNYPPTPEEIKRADRDEDGIADVYDTCPDEFGYKDNKGCPDKDAIIIPFEIQQSWLASYTYAVLDSVINILKANPSYKISIEGHAYKTEGIYSVCNYLASQRAEVVKNYLLSRYIGVSRILSIKNFGNQRPLNAAKNPKDEFLNSRAQIFLNK
jgi:outer membrane protein OmpA-like peptidoglycan-associated protein